MVTGAPWGMLEHGGACEHRRDMVGPVITCGACRDIVGHVGVSHM